MVAGKRQRWHSNPRRNGLTWKVWQVIWKVWRVQEPLFGKIGAAGAPDAVLPLMTEIEW